MAAKENGMEKFEFLIGDWALEYQVPESSFSASQEGIGAGTIRRALGDRYVYFDYECHLPSGDARAHAIFAWDEQAKVYRYWWFEDSGSYLSATCDFVADGILCLNWHDTLLTQTFVRENSDRVVLRMNHPDPTGRPVTILEVVFARR